MLGACGSTTADAPTSSSPATEAPSSAAPSSGEATSPATDDAWSVPATFIDCDAAGIEPGCVGEGTAGTYTSLDSAAVTTPWRVCVTVPHLKDPIWVAVNYGMVTEAQRLGVEMQFLDAGGYGGLTEQVKQIEDCATQGADAIVVGAVSQDALNPVIAEAAADGAVVVDFGNGVTSTDVAGHAIVDYYSMGYAIGEQMAASGESKNVVLLPGPAGAGWVERSALGFKDAVAGSSVTVLDTKYGDTGKEVQLGLVQDVLATYPDVDTLVGTAVTLDVASGVLAERGLTDSIGLYATYLVPTTLDLLENGQAVCAPTEQPVTTARMSIDLAVRLLEGKPPNEGFERMGPEPLVVCGPAAGSSDNLATFDATTSFAPSDWSPVSNVDAAE
ncbi:MAG: TMAO reductase system periplasmic protein TorT [Actinomycetota bacterium]|nr:TMAO reductase system periplasmic protein TorT [Actinomycetota bacterium]